MSSLVRHTLSIAAAIAAFVLFVRALRGPFDAGFLHVHSPLPAEEVFSLSAIGLLLMRRGASSPPAAAGPVRAPGSVLFLALGVIALIFSYNLNDPFLSDDYILVSRASANHFRGIAQSFYTAGGDGSFRPVGGVYFAAVGFWAALVPWRWHLCSLALHIANCGLVYVLVQRLWRNAFTAVMAAVLFGLHGTRPEVVTWTAGNFDSLATSFVLASLIHIFSPHRRKRSLLLASLWLVLAILSKESAYAAPVFAVGLAIVSGRFSDPFLRKACLVTALVCTALFLYRWTLFHGPGGYIDPVTGQPAILSLHFASTAKALLVRLWSVLLFPINWASPHTALLLPSVLASCATFLYLAYTQSVSRTVVSTLLVMTALSVLPAIHLALIDESALGSRILYLPALGICILWAYVLSWQRYWVASAIALCLGLGLLHNLRAWHETALLADRTCAAAAAAGATPERTAAPAKLNGVFFFSNGFPECIAMKRAKGQMAP